MKSVFIILIILGTLACNKNETEPKIKYETFTDNRDGQIYNYIKIGDQIWMAENLKYYSANSWAYDEETYGRLYDWKTACNVCPGGWHLPSKEEWMELITFLGGEDVAGGKLKQIGKKYCKHGNIASNSSGFSALPGGRGSNGNYRTAGWISYFWSSTIDIGSLSFNCVISCGSTVVDMGIDVHRSGESVRCIKD